jgi:ABC-2 type transport system permease protein
MTCGNLFGADGPTFTADAIPGDDFRPILVGKLLSRGTLVLTMVIVGAVAVAAVTGGWAYLPVTLLLAVQSTLLATVPAVFVSIRAPVPLPDKVGGFNANNAGCIAPLMLLASLSVTGVISVLIASPALIITLLVDPFLAIGVPVVTLPVVAWLINRHLNNEAVRLGERVPAMVEALQRA